MKSFKAFIIEQVTQQQLDTLEKKLDKLFAVHKVDIEFTRHFVDRVNDARNKKDITIPELQDLFNKTFQKFGKKISNQKDGFEAVLNDLNTDINVPFAINYNRRTKEVELNSKTVMRKKNFKTPDKKMKV